MRKIFRNTWWFVVPLGFSALFFSTIGFSEYFEQHKIPHSPFEAIYRSMMLFPINMGTIDDEIPIFLEVGRWLALLTLITAGYGTVLALARDRIRLMSLKYSKGHVVICGLGTKGLQIARDFLTDKAWENNVIIVEKNSSVEYLEILRDQGAVVIQGSAADPYVLEKANVINASVLYAVTNDDHVNVNIANWAYNKKIRVKNNGKVNEKDVGTGRTDLRAFVHIFDLTLKNTFKKHRVFRNTKENKNLFSAKIFNIYETSARSILKEYPPDLYTPVCKSEDPPIHIAIVGFGRRGQSLLLQFCKICQYANGKKPIVTIIDPDAEVKIKRLEGKYEALNQVVQIRSFNGVAEDFIVNVKEKKIPINPEGAGSLAAVYVTAGKIFNGFDISERFFREVTRASLPTQVVLCLPRDSCSYEAHTGLGQTGYRIFQMIEESCRVKIIQDETIDEMAKFYHQDYQNVEKAKGKSPETDPSLLDWELLDEEMKESNRLEADHIPVKLRGIACTTEDSGTGNAAFDFTLDRDKVEILTRMEHARWFAERKMSGWTYDPGKKDPVKKINPLLIPYDDLKEEIKQYNRDSVKRIRDVLALSGKKIVLKKL